MPLTSKIRAYDPNWPRKYVEEVARLRPIFESVPVEIHHVGSTAVPHLAAKPEIDILVVVGFTDNLRDWTRLFEAIGYRRGNDLSPDHHFFKRDVEGVRTHKVHLCREGHQTIARMIRFRDHLRRHSGDRDKYQAFKRGLERDNTTGIGEYLAAKAPFIDRMMASLE